MGLGTTCVSMIWRSLSLMRLHSFTISQIVSSKFAASKDFKGYVLWCFVRRQLTWWNCRPMSWCHVVSRSKQSKKKSGFEMFQVHLSTMDVTSVLEFIEYRWCRCPRICFFSSLVPRLWRTRSTTFSSAFRQMFRRCGAKDKEVICYDQYWCGLIHCVKDVKDVKAAEFRSWLFLAIPHFHFVFRYVFSLPPWHQRSWTWPPSLCEMPCAFWWRRTVIATLHHFSIVRGLVVANICQHFDHPSWVSWSLIHLH